MPSSKQEAQDWIEIFGAKEHNLKNIDLKIPRNALTVITGLSGSGKSSIAFDTLYAEGQRRYLETFSSYIRQFIGSLERPDVEKITGLSPVISIEQKTTSKNPRSTVGTITEIYDFLRLLFARIGIAYSPVTGKEMISYTKKQITKLIEEKFDGKEITLLAPVIKSRKGHYQELFVSIAKKGFLSVRVDGQIVDMTKGMKLDRYKTHDIEIVIDTLIVKKGDERVKQSIEASLDFGEDSIIAFVPEENIDFYYSQNLVCPDSGISLEEPEPNSFSFNSAKGSCPDCGGLGYSHEVDKSKLIQDESLSLKKGAIVPIGTYKNNWIFGQIELIGKKFDFTLTTPYKMIPEKAKEAILYGMKDSFQVVSKKLGVKRKYEIDFEGIIPFIKKQYIEKLSPSIQRWAKDFMTESTCKTCDGYRLNENAYYFKIDDKHIGELSHLSVKEFYKWIKDLPEKLTDNEKVIVGELIKEIEKRTSFLVNIGLDYLSLNQSAKTLSGGESQRIRLATQIGSELTNVLYILDEPSIGLHQRDNDKLIQSLTNLKEIGNTLVVVEHDKDMMLAADWLVDVGPKSGIFGGEIIASGKINDVLKQKTVTTDYLNNIEKLEVPKERRKSEKGSLKIFGASGNNLKNIDIEFPLGTLICVTGVSGSGKSTLINETLYPILNAHVYKGVKRPAPYEKVEGLALIDKVIDVNQSPIGRTPRSNPATYTGVFSDIRALFANLPEAKIRGYKPGRFSFNVKGGRCETCGGAGIRIIEMNFLPDVSVECETCLGKRFNRETLEVRYKGKNIYDVLSMTINEAVDFFENIPYLVRKIKALQDVGLGYVTLGQPSTTLSGGEAQRVKLATELSKIGTGNTFYILDEPTTGLHFEDIRVLMNVLQKLVNLGNTVLIIEHNMDVIKLADHIIDLGPEGGKGGGTIIATGTPEEIIKNEHSYTGKYLKKELL